MAQDKLVSNRIKFYLREKKMTQTELGDLIGSNKGYISALISGKKRCPSLAMAIKISEVLGQNVEDVFNYKEE